MNDYGVIRVLCKNNNKNKCLNLNWKHFEFIDLFVTIFTSDPFNKKKNKKLNFKLNF